jgi:hypothetical protein
MREVFGSRARNRAGARIFSSSLIFGGAYAGGSVAGWIARRSVGTHLELVCQFYVDRCRHQLALSDRR